MIKLTIIIPFIFLILLANLSTAYADHNLREIERRWEVEWDEEYGGLDCRSSVSDRRNLE